MGKVNSVALTKPTSDPTPVEGNTFDMSGQVSVGGGPTDYDMHWQWNDGGGWADIASSGALSTAGTNPQNNLSDASAYTIAVDANTAGVYSIRMRTVDHRDGDAEDVSFGQTVTVSAVGGGRRVFVVS